MRVCKLCNKEYEGHGLSKFCSSICYKQTRNAKIRKKRNPNNNPSKRLIDLTGKTFGTWTVLKRGVSKKNITTWTSVCKCGTTRDVTSVNLLAGRSRGCKKCSHTTKGVKLRIPLIEHAFKYFIRYKNSEKRNRDGLPVTINSTEWYNMAKNNCHYCNQPPVEFSPYKGIKESIFVNGLDRVDNSKGYTLENCVPCCNFCNKAKRDLTKDHFLQKIKEIYEKSCK